jgi:hypothetical protein
MTFLEADHPRVDNGTFTDKPQTSPEVSLSGTAKDWGTITVNEGSRTPWGPADSVTNIAPGIVSVGTPGHGGLTLSRERRAAIPKPLRDVAGTWFEEDCEWWIVAMHHPEAFPHIEDGVAEQRVRNWFPDAYEAATGTTIAPGESDVRDEAVWAKAHENDFVLIAASMDDDRPGVVRVLGRRASDSTRQTFYVPKAELDARRLAAEPGQGHRVILDPASDETSGPDAEPEKVPTVKHAGYSTPATPGARARLATDLAKRWRRDDGTVETLEDILERGVAGKSSRVENGKRIYFLREQEFEGSSYAALPVTKATFDAVNAPDGRSAADVAYQDAQIAEHKLHRADGWTERQKLQAAYNEAARHADELRKAETAAEEQ